MFDLFFFSSFHGIIIYCGVVRRILSMGAHSCELFCNLGLCCLYGGQLDLVFPCFQRAIRLATTPEQRADVWYNLSFVALVSSFISIIFIFFGLNSQLLKIWWTAVLLRVLLIAWKFPFTNTIWSKFTLVHVHFRHIQALFFDLPFFHGLQWIVFNLDN